MVRDLSMAYVQALQQALATRGLPRKLYVDNGSAFRCRQLEQRLRAVVVALKMASGAGHRGAGLDLIYDHPPSLSFFSAIIILLTMCSH
jgi:transposase InsO family protein